jgi:hypothetical protein
MDEARRIWQNAMTFNQQGSQAWGYALDLAMLTEKMFVQRFTPTSTHDSKKRKATSPEEKVRSPTSPADQRPGSMSPVTQEAPAQLEERPVQPPPATTTTATTAPTKSVAAVEDARPMELAELEQLGAKIGCLDTSALTHVLSMVQAKQQTDGDLELDLSTVPPATLRAVERYVDTVLGTSSDQPNAKRQKM